jgi:hypothetical protein
MRVSSALRGLLTVALASLVSAQTSEQPLLRPVGDDDDSIAPEPEPGPAKTCDAYNTGEDECAKHCPIWSDCGKLSVSGKFPELALSSASEDVVRQRWLPFGFCPLAS